MYTKHITFIIICLSFYLNTFYDKVRWAGVRKNGEKTGKMNSYKKCIAGSDGKFVSDSIAGKDMN